MSNLAHATPRMSPSEYLAFEEDAPVKHEYLNGSVHAMAGASPRHNLIAQNLLIALRPTARSAGCQVFISDVKLKVRTLAGEFFYYPDVLMSCTAADRNPLLREQPVLLIEVASPSTERIDRGEKLNNYRQIPSLIEYVIVEQKRHEVEIYRRRNGWVCEVIEPDQPLALECVGLTLSMSDIYSDIDFEDPTLSET
ncbi:MAG: Uma2 family endonuclease [Hyphomicrobiaceae bacterium]